MLGSSSEGVVRAACACSRCSYIVRLSAEAARLEAADTSAAAVEMVRVVGRGGRVVEVGAKAWAGGGGRGSTCREGWVKRRQERTSTTAILDRHASTLKHG